MARYISRSPKYSVGIGEPEMAQVNGLIFEQRPKKIGKFQQGLALEHEIEAALKAFTFRGLPDGVPPETMISVFDTSDYQKANKLSDEERENVEEWLESLPSFGADYIKVEELRAPKPWPSYDEDSVEDIVAAVDRFHFDVEDVRRYEQENENRSELLAQLVERGAGNVERSDLDELRPFDKEVLELTDSQGAKKHVVVKA